MRIVLTFCMLAVMAAAAQAKLRPHERIESVPPGRAGSPEVWSIYLGPAAALLESDYFRAPHGMFTSERSAPCRLNRRGGDGELRLIYSCWR